MYWCLDVAAWMLVAEYLCLGWWYMEVGGCVLVSRCSCLDADGRVRLSGTVVHGGWELHVVWVLRYGCWYLELGVGIRVAGYWCLGAGV